MIKVLQIGLTSSYAGIENFIFNHYHYLDHSTVDFEFIHMFGERPPYVERIGNIEGKFYSLGNYKKKPIGVAWKLRKLLRAKHYDIIHINISHAVNMIPVWEAVRSNIRPIIVHSHSSGVCEPHLLVKSALHKMNVPLLRRCPVEKWACSTAAGRWMWGKTFDASNVIPNAIDTDRFRFDVQNRNDIRESCEFQKADKVIGFVGRLAEQKNVMFLPEILDELRKISCDYKMLIVGGGDLRDSLSDKIQRMGLTQHIFLAGSSVDTSPWYSAMDAFILPSHFEGLPIVGLEAQACGLPCFVSDAVSKELNITNTVQYLAIDQGSKIWADAIHAALRNPSPRTSEFPKEYQIAHAAKELEKRYMSLISRSKQQ